MRILNVLKIDGDVPNIIESFPIYEEQLSQEVIEKASLLFIEKINELIYPDVLSDEKQEFYINQGSFYHYKNINVFLIWSYTD